MLPVRPVHDHPHIADAHLSVTTRTAAGVSLFVEEPACRHRDLVILELNGVTGEPAHVYQPGYPWWKGMRDLCRHWRRACEIGAANRRAGAAANKYEYINKEEGPTTNPRLY